MNRKYDLENRGNIGVITDLKIKIETGATKVRRFEERTRQYHQNNLFAQNQKQLNSELNGGKCSNEKPDAQEATSFWSNIWSTPMLHNTEATWIERVKNKLKDVKKQENININLGNLKTAIKRLTNWKAPGPDGV